MQVDSKNIIDSVHGNINIPKDYFVLIDTPEFQRLRRLEQSPIRSIFPCAHHDRFIHSLGVYHIGNLITKQLHNEAAQSNYYGIGDEYKKIERSYLVACLLHDIGHAPFSHTFEKYYGKKRQLCNRLIELVGNKEFEKEIDADYEYAGEHEYLSAIIVMSQRMAAIIKELQAEPELVARMIIGRKYSLTKRTRSKIKEIKNCFISLLNGGIIDADRLDYACRDVWASGYATSTIDMERMVAGIHISQKQETKVYEICFSANILNEIKSVVAVKDFQVQYVINHHVVVYDLDLLERAANEMAKCYYQHEPNAQSLSNIISEASLKNEINRLTTNEKQLNLQLLSDDDIVVLIKNCLINQQENKYYKEWKSRSYEMFPIWKTKDEFFYYYKNLLPINKYLSEDRFFPLITQKLQNKYPYLFHSTDDIRIIKCNFKPQLCLDDLNILICNEMVKYSELIQKKESNLGYKFYYVYVSKECIDRYKRRYRSQIAKPDYEIKNKIRLLCLDALKPIFEIVYYSKDDMCFNLVLEHKFINLMPNNFITIDCDVIDCNSGSNYVHYLGIIGESENEKTSHGTIICNLLNKYIDDGTYEQFIGFDLYVNRIRLYLSNHSEAYHCASKIIGYMNEELKNNTNIGGDVMIIRERT